MNNNIKQNQLDQTANIPRERYVERGPRGGVVGNSTVIRIDTGDILPETPKTSPLWQKIK